MLFIRTPLCVPHSIHRGVFMLCKPKPSARRKRLRRYAILIVIAIILISLFIEFAVKVQLSDVIAAGMRTLAQRAMNAAVVDCLGDHPDIGERLTEPHYGDSGTVVSITSDPSAVNFLKATVSGLAQDHIERLSQTEGITVPLGSFTGFVLLANLGPGITLGIDSRATVTCTLKSTFESAGVNQTLHHVILTVNADIVVYNPFRIAGVIRTSADFEIAQTVIVGDVPAYSGYLTH